MKKHEELMKEYEENMKKYERNVEKYEGNMRKYAITGFYRKFQPITVLFRKF